MKVIKRDGRAVDYDKQKIAIAIGKANNEVTLKKRASAEEIKQIISYIESLGKKRMLVEDIQDIIEQKLMEFQKYELAKKYIVYRYTRALVRKANTTDESILGLIRNENKHLQKASEENIVLASKQRNYIAGEVSRDLTKRLLLPEKITKADQEGVLHFHNADYFVQPIINNSYINLEFLLNNEFKIDDYKVKSPQNFIEACQILLDIIIDVANNQYGIQNLDLTCLGKYFKNATKEEVGFALKSLKQHLNTIMINGNLPYVNFFIRLDETLPYFNENNTIIQEINNIELANNKNIFFEITDNKERKEKFDQGKVTINLVQIALYSNENKEIFFNELKRRLELCKEALMCKHYALLGTVSDVSPILWQNGGIACLDKGQKIDSLLENGISTLSLGYIGEEECNYLINISKGEILEIMQECIKTWTKETSIKFILDKQASKEISSKFLEIDKEKYGVIKNITDKDYYEITRDDG